MEEIAINPTIELPELTQDWGNRLLEDRNKILCTRTHKKGAATTQETGSDLPVSVQESLVEAWVSGGLLQVLEH